MTRTMTLPKIGVNMTEAVVDSWFVKEGDRVREGDAILLAETDKATQDIYATDSGIVAKLLVKEGDCSAPLFDTTPLHALAAVEYALA